MKQKKQTTARNKQQQKKHTTNEHSNKTQTIKPKQTSNQSNPK